MTTEYYTLSAIIEQVAHSGKAIRILDGGNDIWLPLSLIQVDKHPVDEANIDAKAGELVDITMPEWLALKKGLI